MAVTAPMPWRTWLPSRRPAGRSPNPEACGAGNAITSPGCRRTPPTWCRRSTSTPTRRTGAPRSSGRTTGTRRPCSRITARSRRTRWPKQQGMHHDAHPIRLGGALGAVPRAAVRAVLAGAQGAARWFHAEGAGMNTLRVLFLGIWRALMLIGVAIVMLSLLGGALFLILSVRLYLGYG